MSNSSSIIKETHYCNKCGHPIHYILGANAVNVVCEKCGTLYEGAYGKLLKSSATFETTKSLLVLLIGSIGTIKGIKYQVIGYVKKQEKGTSYYWEEFTLFNPIHGYATLSLYNGHWIYLTEMDDIPSKTSEVNTINYENNSFDIYSRYQSIIVKAAGEFPFHLNKGTAYKVEEYIIPPHMISSERSNDELVWYWGEYIQPEEIKNAFKLVNIPEQEGVGVIQPFSSKFKHSAFKRILLIIALLFGGLHILFTFFAKDEIVFDQNYVVDDSLNKKEIFTKPFDLKYGTKNAEVKIVTNIDNNWIYTGVTMVNETSGDIYDVDLEAEYYHGYDDGHWSEGSTWTAKVISQVPEGKYFLIIYSDKPANKNINLEVIVTRDISVISNLFVVLIILAIYPVIYFYRRRKFEKDRWYNSNYSPYEYDDDENY